MATNLKHPVYDTDTHFTIDPVSREMSNTACLKSCLIQHDHNSERFTFEVPKTIEGHDMSKCDSIQVHYINIDSQTKEQSAGVYEVDDMMLTEDPAGDRIYFSWLISHNATEYVGSLSFLIRFSCYGDDGFLSYVWNTAIYSGISISNGIDNGEVIIDDYADILNEWRKETEAFRLLSLEQTQTSTESEGVNIWTATFADGATRTLEVRNGAQGEKGDGIENPDDYVMKTDLAEINGDAGLIHLSSSTYGINLKDFDGIKRLIVYGATESGIRSKGSAYMPITPKYIDLATKVGVTTNTLPLSPEEKLAAAEWLGTARIVTGTYIGAGKYGPENPNVLTFDGPVEFLLVYPSGELVHHNNQTCIRLMMATGEIVICNDDTTLTTIGSYTTFTQTGVSWYAIDVDGRRPQQCNYEGQEYTYFAVLRSSEEELAA